MRWLTMIVLVLLSLSACGTVEHPLTSGTDQAIPGQGADPLPYPGSTETAIVLPDTTPEASTPAVPPPSMVPSTPPLEPLPPTEVQVLTLTTEPAAWHDFTLTTVYTDTTARFEYRLFGWSSQTPRLLLTNDTILGILDANTGIWTEIEPNAPVTEAAWSPSGDKVVYITTDTIIYTGNNSYKLWIWDAISGSHKVIDIPLKLTTNTKLFWTEDNIIRLIFGTRIVSYTIDLNTIIKEEVVFDAPQEYIQHTPGMKSVEPDPNALILLAPDGIHGIVSDKNNNNSLKGFIREDSIINTITIDSSPGYYTWSQDSSLVAIPLEYNKLGIYNSQGNLEYYIEHKNISMKMLAVAEWSPDKEYLVYRMSNESSTNAYIVKINDIGSIKLNIEEMNNGGVSDILWSNKFPYIVYTMYMYDVVENKSINKIFIVELNKQ